VACSGLKKKNERKKEKKKKKKKENDIIACKKKLAQLPSATHPPRPARAARLHPDNL
jgi:hypothetical protein